METVKMASISLHREDADADDDWDDEDDENDDDEDNVDESIELHV
jgi:hypothetical protein